MRSRLVSFFAPTLLAMSLTACHESNPTSELDAFADIASALPGTDGNFNVVCKNGTVEIVSATNLGQACDPKITPIEKVPNPAIEVKTNGADFCARYADNTLKCWTSHAEGESAILKRPAFLGNKVLDFSINSRAACAVDVSGAVQCWGSNDGNLLNVPLDLTAPKSTKKVAVGIDAACALKADGSVSCWGTAETSKAKAIPSDLGTVTDLINTNYSFCGIRTDETLKCWGADFFVSVIPTDLGPVKSFQGGSSDSCAVLASGSTYCWPTAPAFGSTLTNVPAGAKQGVKQVVVNDSTACALRENATPICWGDNSKNQQVFPTDLKPVTQLAIGYKGYCAVQNNGEIMCWNFGGTKTSTSQTHIAKFLVAKDGGICSLNQDGQTLCWGRNYYTEGSFDRFSSLFDVDRSASSALTIDEQSLALGGDHSCFLTEGYLQCRGANFAGQGYLYAPVDDGDNAGLVAGTSYNCSLRVDGSVKCWGDNSKNQLLVPKDLTKAKVLAAGFDHNCAVAQDDSVKCWGNNDLGQSQAPALSNVTALALGKAHSCALSNDSVSCWGDNSQGQVAVPALGSGVKKIAAGTNHSCAIKADDTLVCWGSESKGETTVPASLGKASSVAAGNSFSCAVASVDSTVQCWGDNTFGVIEVPGQSRMGERALDSLGDRIFSYGFYTNLMVEERFAERFYHPVYQEAYAYQGLRGSDGKDLAYDLRVVYDRACEVKSSLAEIGLSLVNRYSSSSGRPYPTTDGTDQLLTFTNLRGPSRIFPGTYYGKPDSAYFSTDLTRAENSCLLQIKSVTLLPATNIDSVLKAQATTLSEDLDKALSTWLQVRTSDDVTKDGVAKSKENLNAKKTRIISEAQNLLYTYGVAPINFGYTGDFWTEEDPQKAFFTDLTSAYLLQDDFGKKAWEGVLLGRPQTEWPNWAQGLFSIYVDALGKTAGEYIGQQLLDYQTLLERLKGDAAPSMTLTLAESQLKETVNSARQFLINTSEVRATFAAEIKILQASASKGGDVCKKTGTTGNASQCQ